MAAISLGHCDFSHVSKYVKSLYFNSRLTVELLTANRYLLFDLNAILPASAALSTLFFSCPLKMILEQAATVLKIIKNRRRGLGIIWIWRWEGDHWILVSQGQVNLSLSLENKSVSFCEPLSIFFLIYEPWKKEKGRRYRDTWKSYGSFQE